MEFPNFCELPNSKLKINKEIDPLILDLKKHNMKSYIMYLIIYGMNDSVLRSIIKRNAYFYKYASSTIKNDNQSLIFDP